MQVLILWADETSANLGVRVLAAGTAALVRRAVPDAETTFLNYGLDTAPMRVGDWRRLAKEHVTGREGLREWFSGFDLVIDTRAGDSFTDAYGLQRLLTMNLVAEFVRRAGIPLILGPQTLGPFRTAGGRLLGARALRAASSVIARDSISRDYAAGFGVHPLLASDVVFALPVPRAPVSRDVLLNVSGLLWNDNPHVPSQKYRRIVGDVLSGLQRAGRSVSLVAHVLDNPTADNDVRAAQELAAVAGGDLDVVVPHDLDELRRVVATAGLVIGSRMHACLNALSCGTPAVPLAYSRKFAPLLADLNWSATVDLNGSDPVARVLDLAADPGLGVAAAGVRAAGAERLQAAVALIQGNAQGSR